MQNAHLSALEAKHASLDQKISAESRRPRPDQMIIADLKRRKLKVKEEIALS
ncbi:YdcH family protein [Sphingomonas sp. ST-64]|uniref:YdcH family protein n=1 Tax=Sphingomonas plantiphila TaxID=3163295 RepID=A0ABW8YQZ5_9SPHN